MFSWLVTNTGKAKDDKTITESNRLFLKGRPPTVLNDDCTAPYAIPKGKINMSKMTKISTITKSPHLLNLDHS